MTFFELKENVAFKICRFIPQQIHPMYLTIARLALVIPLVFLLLSGMRMFAIVLFLIMAFLDYIDGPLARIRNQVSVTGKLLDPFADKMMVLPVFYIVAFSVLPLWLIWATIGLEIVLVLLAFLLKPFFENIGQRRSLGANKFGKYKMTFQTVGVLWLLVLPASLLVHQIALYIFYLALILSLLSIAKHMMPERSIHD